MYDPTECPAIMGPEPNIGSKCELVCDHCGPHYDSHTDCHWYGDGPDAVLTDTLGNVVAVPPKEIPGLVELEWRRDHGYVRVFQRGRGAKPIFEGTPEAFAQWALVEKYGDVSQKLDEDWLGYMRRVGREQPDLGPVLLIKAVRDAFPELGLSEAAYFMWEEGIRPRTQYGHSD